MQVIVNVPETLPEDILHQFIEQFEKRLEKEAQNLKDSYRQSSKWAKIAQEAHDESPLRGLSDYVLECSQEIRDNFVFQHNGVS